MTRSMLLTTFIATLATSGCLPRGGGGGSSEAGVGGSGGAAADGGMGFGGFGGAGGGEGGGEGGAGGAGGGEGGAGGGAGGGEGGAGGGVGGEGGGAGGVGGEGGDCQPERCDGVDNDCDGAIDEDFEGLDDACAMGLGECAAEGTWICAPDGQGVVCDAIEGRPEGERCDGLDNDCDGIVDNGLGLGELCWAGQGACEQEGELVCGPDGDVVCNAAEVMVGEEICDGLDNDCDGDVDESLGVGQRCTEGLGQCRAEGARVCDGEGGVICDAVPGEPEIEVCDGLDNDCDGLVDNDCGGGGGVALPPNQGFGHHGQCNQWNECVDAQGCANRACEAAGHGPAVAWEEAVCGPDYVCRIFRDNGSIDEGWTPLQNCNLPIAVAVVCEGDAPPQREICDDRVDNDGDGRVDCADRDCNAHPACGGMNGQVGEFVVGDGAPWREARSMSCVAACASLFGGDAGDYGCSTVDGVYNGRAYVDGYGDTQYCAGEGVAEDFVEPEEGGVYNCGAQACSYSAYVGDHAQCDSSTNYCWRVMAP